MSDEQIHEQAVAIFKERTFLQKRIRGDRQAICALEARLHELEQQRPDKELETMAREMRKREKAIL